MAIATDGQERRTDRPDSLDEECDVETGRWTRLTPRETQFGYLPRAGVPGVYCSEVDRLIFKAWEVSPEEPV